MIGVLLVTHGEVGSSIIKAAQDMVGTLEKVEALSIKQGEGAPYLRERIVAAISRLHDGAGVLLLVDIMGGTPGNVALTLVKDYPIEILAGVNLPMVISLLTHRKDSDLITLAQRVKEKGRAGVVDLKEEWRRYHGTCAG